eukprot:349674-Chlamydomonas_euryale.AAC.5
MKGFSLSHVAAANFEKSISTVDRGKPQSCTAFRRRLGISCRKHQRGPARGLSSADGMAVIQLHVTTMHPGRGACSWTGRLELSSKPTNAAIQNV